MKRIEEIAFTKTILMLLLLLSFPAFAQNDRGIKRQSQRTALIIGNSAYQAVPLKNPVNDADDMAATLKNLGFKVILRKNVDQRTMEDTIRYFGRQLKDNGVGFFYFAGHGIQVEGRNYLMPIDANIESESDV
ncbi:MAG: caspase family protein, partial [Deltaproteobacteria bacterium]|nr:caspase family protein [Deltaproteobacteria bacterium]